MNSLFSGKGELKFADYVLHASSWSNNKKSRILKRKGKVLRTSISTAAAEYFASPPPSEVFRAFLDTSTESLKEGRKTKVPFHENCIRTSMKLVTLIKVIHEHGKSC
jgi:hypothetical protein